MERFLLSVPSNVTLPEIIASHLKEKLLKSKFILINDSCVLIEGMDTLACIDDVLQNTENLDDYVLVQIARGKREEGAPFKLYLYPSNPNVNDTRNEEAILDLEETTNRL